MNSRRLTAAGLVLVAGSLLAGSLLAALVLMLQDAPEAGQGRAVHAPSPTSVDEEPVRVDSRAAESAVALRTRIWSTGAKQMEGLVDASGRRQGVWRMWHENGQLQFEGSYVDGRLDAALPWREYNADGSIRFDSEDGPPPAELLSVVAVTSNAQF